MQLRSLLLPVLVAAALVAPASATAATAPGVAYPVTADLARSLPVFRWTIGTQHKFVQSLHVATTDTRSESGALTDVAGAFQILGITVAKVTVKCSVHASSGRIVVSKSATVNTPLIARPNSIGCNSVRVPESYDGQRLTARMRITGLTKTVNAATKFTAK